ncbi:hypothetical protein KSP39_PZI010485 [Platanthera zijinensis]|uniref:Uncharacterized protein n=1 Tax=Platanthera zijinensis TaxID=2320716 RepID=A0AAP0BIP3_9ASPA
MGVRGIAVDSASAPRSVTGSVPGDGEEGLDLFIRRRGAALIGSLGESSRQNGLIKNTSVGLAVTDRTRADDFHDAEIGKHDYDWLLTPPGTPKFPSSDTTENQLTSITTKNRSMVKSSSTARASRLSVSQSENGHSTKPVRSSSVNRPSISVTASATSKPSTPGNRSGSTVSRPTQARSANPAKTRPNLSSAGDKSRPSQSSRPSTPTARPQLPSTNITSPNVRSNSRSSTPTRRQNIPGISSSPATTTARSPSAAGRLPASRNSGPCSRPGSPGPRTRAPATSLDPTLFSHDAPPNLRTKLPEKPASASRMRPGIATMARSKLPDKSATVQLSKSEHGTVLLEIQKSMVWEPGVRRASSKAGMTESTGFGRTISKMSIDMALKHMDIRQNMGGIRANTIFPHSIRHGNASKSSTARGAEPIFPMTNDGRLLTEAGRCNIAVPENRPMASKPMNKDALLVKDGCADLYGSSRYDTMLLKEDLKNTNWLHSLEDRPDQSPVFDHRFEPPPEPFSPL